MERLFSFIYQYRVFFTFLVLELLCVWLVVRNNQYQGARYFNTSNRLAAQTVAVSQNISGYFSLREVNAQLAEENARLRKKLEQRNQSLYSLETRELKDPAIINKFDFVSARVINNSTSLYKNYITINKGSTDGIAPGMAALNELGAVGKVKTVSKHFSVLISVLNIDNQISCVVKRTGYFGTAQWDGLDPQIVDLKYIPRHVKIQPGDTVVTSGYNAVFPPDVPVGVVKSATIKEEAPFYDIKVALSQDFAKLSFVEIVRSNLKAEKDSLELTMGEKK
jgi:rod shape-determining protein MreC